MSRKYKNGKPISSLIKGDRIQLPFGLPITVNQIISGDSCYIEGTIDGDTRLHRFFVVSTDFCVEVLTKKGGAHDDSRV